MTWLLLRLGVGSNLTKILSPFLGALMIVGAFFGTYVYGKHVESKVWEHKMELFSAAVKEAKQQDADNLKALRGNWNTSLESLKAQLQSIAEQAATTRIIIKEVPKYVTPAADYRCSLTDGFLYVYNYPLRSEAPGVASSPPTDVDSPTGIKASDVAANAASNYSECVARGQIITLWQQWYAAHRDAYEVWRSKIAEPPEIPH